LITRYQDKGINPVTGAEILINTYVNANSSQSYGAELTSINYLTKWWDMTTNLNIYNSKINAGNLTNATQPAMWSWFGKFNSNFKLPAKFSMQLSATYQSKTNLPLNTGGGMMGPGGPAQAQSSAQGYIKPSYGVDLAVKKTFLKNDAAAVTFSISDIFKTRVSEQYSYSDYFVQTYSRLRDPQMFRINFTYRFGKMDMSLFKRKNTRQDMSGATEGMQQ
jgi:outer membrane receptor for ferrienterochelin and colicin